MFLDQIISAPLQTTQVSGTIFALATCFEQICA